jgi:hypothetical protein
VPTDRARLIGERTRALTLRGAQIPEATALALSHDVLGIAIKPLASGVATRTIAIANQIRHDVAVAMLNAADSEKLQLLR